MGYPKCPICGYEMTGPYCFHCGFDATKILIDDENTDWEWPFMTPNPFKEKEDDCGSNSDDNDDE